MTDSAKDRALKTLRDLMGVDSFDAMCGKHKDQLAQTMVDFVEKCDDDSAGPGFALFDGQGQLKGGQDIPDTVIDALRKVVGRADGVDVPDEAKLREVFTAKMVELAHKQYVAARAVCQSVLEAYEASKFGEATHFIVAHTIFDDMMSALFLDQVAWANALNVRYGINADVAPHIKDLKANDPELHIALDAVFDEAITNPMRIARETFHERVRDKWDAVQPDSPDGNV